jgi:release factor glutamine methyltransferase
MTYQKLLKEQMKRAASLGKEETAVKLLILELSGKDGATFLADIKQEIDKDLEVKLMEAIDEYLIKGRPVQHIIGYSYFYGYKMKVSEEVLIPRPETEELVGYVLSYYDEVFDGAKVDVIDVGTGSGAIAVALACEEPNMTVSASDISPTAVEVAKINAKNNDANVKFFVGDMLQPFIENNYKVDILVSNPPYIPDDEYVEDIVLNNEPHVALFGGSDGMHFYKIILEGAKQLLKEKNILAFEHSFSKGKEMYELAKKHFPNGEIIQIKDLNDKDRMTIIINK